MEKKYRVMVGDNLLLNLNKDTHNMLLQKKINLRIADVLWWTDVVELQLEWWQVVNVPINEILFEN